MKFNRIFFLIICFICLQFKLFAQEALLIKGDSFKEILILEKNEIYISYVLRNNENTKIYKINPRFIYRIFCQDSSSFKILHGNDLDKIAKDSIEKIAESDAKNFYREYKSYQTPIILSSFLATPLVGLIAYNYGKKLGVDSTYVTKRNDFLWQNLNYKNAFISTALSMNKSKAKKSFLAGSILFTNFSYMITIIIYMFNKHVNWA